MNYSCVFCQWVLNGEILCLLVLKCLSFGTGGVEHKIVLYFFSFVSVSDKFSLGWLCLPLPAGGLKLKWTRNESTILSALLLCGYTDYLSGHHKDIWVHQLQLFKMLNESLLFEHMRYYVLLPDMMGIEHISVDLSFSVFQILSKIRNSFWAARPCLVEEQET